MESLITGIYMEVINTNPVNLVMSFSKNSLENTLVQVRLELSEVSRSVLGFGCLSAGAVGPGYFWDVLCLF